MISSGLHVTKEWRVVFATPSASTSEYLLDSSHIDKDVETIELHKKYSDKKYVPSYQESLQEDNEDAEGDGVIRGITKATLLLLKELG